MNIEKDIKILKELMENVELTFGGWVDILNEREKNALNNVLEDYEKQKQINEKLKDELNKAEKENKVYKTYNKENRYYWINQGKISLAKKLLEDK